MENISHVIIRTDDGRILESKGAAAATRLVKAMGDAVQSETFELRESDEKQAA